MSKLLLQIISSIVFGLFALALLAPARADEPGPATRPITTRPATRSAEQTQRQLLSLTRKAIDQIQKKKFDDAEATLQQALNLAPDHPTNLYNMACVKALRGRHDAAVDYLKQACMAGFTDFIHIQRDSDLDSIRKHDGYKAIISAKDHFQKLAATRVLGYLKREFGEGYLYEVDEKNKLIFATNTDRATLDAVKKNMLTQAQSQWKQLFSHKPDQYISVILPSPKDYRQIVRQPGVGGFYNPENRILICQRLGQIMTHEFTHALHSADIEAVGQEHPIWLIEGIASLYEAGQFDEQDELQPSDNFRLPMLQMAARTNKLIPLDKLLKMEQRQFVSNATLAYGQASSLLLFLHERKELRKFYETFKANYDKDKSGRETLEKVTGLGLADLDKEWRQWMTRRKAPAMNTGQDGPVIGVRFSDANDGMRIDQVVPTGPGARDGLKVGDVVVGIDGLDVRDQQSLMPLLAQHKVGDTITLKVRRGPDYLDLPITLARRGELVHQPATKPASTPSTRPSR